MARESGVSAMHIILAFLAVLGGAAFWWWRLKMLNEAAGEVGDAAGRAWGAWKRHKFRKKVESSPYEAVSDPAAAAVIMMVALAKRDGELPGKSEAAIAKEVANTMAVDDPTELMTFAKWVASHGESPSNVSIRYARLWNSSLTPAERRDLLAMCDRTAVAAGPLTDEQRAELAALSRRLGLQE